MPCLSRHGPFHRRDGRSPTERGWPGLISVRGLSITYRTPARNVPAVRDVSLEIPAGRITAIVGGSGGGKSSLIYGILRLLPPRTELSGSIFFDGTDLVSTDEEWMREFRWKRAALITQGAMNSLTPVLTVGYQISEVLQVRLGLSRREAEKRTLELLAMTNLTQIHARKFPHELSGGEKQRAVISMAVSCFPGLLIADEPTSALDMITQAEVVTTLVGMVRDQGMGLLLVTHDLPLAISVCDDLAVMYEGRIVETGTPSKILRSPSHEHTRKLLSAFSFKGGARP